MVTTPQSLCVLRLSAIGDVCHTLPVVRTLQAALPESEITWIIGKTEASLVGDIAGIEFITFDKRTGLTGMRALRRQLANRRFDVLLQMQVALRASALSRFIPAQSRIGFDRARARDFQWLFTDRHIAAREQQHVMDGLFGFAEAMGIQERLLRWDIPLAQADRDFAADHLPGNQPVLLISPCSSTRARNFRNWSVERYAAVAAHAVNSLGMQVVVTGGPTALERDYGARIAADAGVPVTNLVGRSTLKQLFALIERAAVVMCPDSGPAHMATAAGTPVVGLYATSNPDRTGPYDRSFTVNRYPDALMQAYGKRVDEVRWGARVRTPDAMDLITVAEVCAQLDAALAQSLRTKSVPQ